MKKKNVLMMALSLCLVAVIAVGGTLAYLSDTADAVTNTFQFAAGIDVTLSEDQPIAVKNESISANTDNGYDYTNVVPGQELNKAPKLTVTTSVDAYVFARVTVGANMTLGTITTGWTQVPGETNVWYKAVTGAEGVQDLDTLFTKVTVGNVQLDGTEELGDIVIEVAAVQQSGFASVEAAYEAANTDNVFQAA